MYLELPGPRLHPLEDVGITLENDCEAPLRVGLEALRDVGAPGEASEQ
jgi:hypothetical protein